MSTNTLPYVAYKVKDISLASWGIKETVFKVKNEVGISFIDHIYEDNFELDDKKAQVQLHFNNQIEHFETVFDSIEEYIFVCAYLSNAAK